MKAYITILALAALPACMGGGGGGVDVTPSSPSVSMNNDFGTLLNGVRMGAGEAAVSYDSRIGQAAQDHANDMINRNYFTVTIPGTVGNNNGMEDIGDRVTAEGYSWQTIVQLIEQGDYTLTEALNAFDNSGACGGGGQDPCIVDDRLQNFGIAKAGAGAGQKWVLVLTEPN